MCSLIRQAVYSDIESLSLLIHDAWQKDLFSLVAPNASESLSVEVFVSKLKENMSCEAESIIVCEINDKIVGYASGSTTTKDFDSEIVALYVSPKAQQSGVGSTLFSEMKSFFKSQHKSNMIVWTLLDAPNNQFYAMHNPEHTVNRNIKLSGRNYPGIGFVYSL